MNEKNRNYDAIVRYVEASDLPGKPNKLEGIAIARAKGISMKLVHVSSLNDPLILVDGISIDPSELENGYWL